MTVWGWKVDTALQREQVQVRSRSGVEQYEMDAILHGGASSAHVSQACVRDGCIC